MPTEMNSQLAIRPRERSKFGLTGTTRAFTLIAFLVLIQLYWSFWVLIQSPLKSDYYSHLILIPLISLYLGYRKREEIVSRRTICTRCGVPVLAAGVILYIIGILNMGQLNLNDSTALVNLGALTFLGGSFLLFYGPDAARTALFPLSFLLFSIPIPSNLMTEIIHFLQSGSANLVQAFFALLGISFIREGFVFSLPNVSIEIAEQCSGIRSSLALLITGSVIAGLFLTRPWSRIALLVSILPLAIFKNACRITALTLLGAHVDKGYLSDSALHTRGGFLFYAIALTLLVGIVWTLRCVEKKTYDAKIP